MDEFDDFDPTLFGLWQERPVYGGEIPEPDAALAEEVRAVLEVKSADGLTAPGEQLRQILNDMTVEMRAQFATFRQMRESAAEALVDGDEAAQKLARADVKAATDAMSLIIRTLEKVDSLQRQLARDREAEAERAADAGGYEEAKARFVQMIKDRANETALLLYEEWKRTGPPDAVLGSPGHKVTEPADEEAGERESGGRRGHGLDADDTEHRDDRGGIQGQA